MKRINDYAIIGNGRSTALIARDGSIDWLCWPRLDSPPLFAALLDEEKGGGWSIAPCGYYDAQRQYLDRTNILQTTYETSSGRAVLTDLMPAADGKEILWAEREILRKVECLSGHIELMMAFSLCVLQKTGRPRVTVLGARFELPSGLLTLLSSIPLTPDGDDLPMRFSLQEGQTVYFSLSMATEAPAVLPALTAAEQRIALTARWWRRFMGKLSCQGPYQDYLCSSAMVLKLMSYAPSGAIIASPTTSLPERFGGDLNWDYRYCWLRDAALTTRALTSLGMRAEAEAFVSWLLHATNLTRPKVKVLYDVYGRKPVTEKSVPLSGHRNSRPVRIGNLAADQDQLDVYGEVIVAAADIFSTASKIDRDTQSMLKELGSYIARHWTEEDAGMWEVRGRLEHFTHSLVLCWAGLNALLKLYQRGLLSGTPSDDIKIALRRTAHMIHTFAWNEQTQSYVSILRGREVDANLLLMPWYGIVPFTSPLMRRTYERIKEDLLVSNGFFHRNHDQEEGAFVLCSFWAVEYLARGGGSLDEATALFEKTLAFSNDVGFFSEEIDASGDFLGNFPLTFSHLGVVNAAKAIEERMALERCGV